MHNINMAEVSYTMAAKQMHPLKIIIWSGVAEGKGGSD